MEKYSPYSTRLRTSQTVPAAWRTRYRDLGAGYVGTVARALEDEAVE